jgi:mRNA interferase MazF
VRYCRQETADRRHLEPLLEAFGDLIRDSFRFSEQFRNEHSPKFLGTVFLKVRLARAHVSETAENLGEPRGVVRRLRGSAAPACHEDGYGRRPTDKPTARIDRGDVFWVGRDDLHGPGRGHPHPHVVVRALTSNLRRASWPGNVLLEAGLPRRSVVVVSQVSSVEKAHLGEKIGSLSEARVEEILDGLRFQQRSFFGR